MRLQFLSNNKFCTSIHVSTPPEPRRPKRGRRKLYTVLAVFLLGVPTGAALPQPTPHYICTYAVVLHQDGHQTVVPTSAFWKLDPAP